MKLADILNGEGDIDQNSLRKSFMLYSKPINVEGKEKEAVAILLNLSHSMSLCKELTDCDRAKMLFSDETSFSRSLEQIKYIHTHNLKFPDPRVEFSDCKIITKCILEHSQETLRLGWAYCSNQYKYVTWLVNSFEWQGKETSILLLIIENNPFWLKLLAKFGLSATKLKLFNKELESHFSQEVFPDKVSKFSKQFLYPYNKDYIAITPVASHSFQVMLERAIHQKNFKFSKLKHSHPYPVAIGNLYGSLGGSLSLLNYPIDIKNISTFSLFNSRLKSGRYLADQKLFERKFCSVLKSLCGYKKESSKKKRLRTRKNQLKSIRNQLIHWLMPLLELREQCDREKKIDLCFHRIDDELIRSFLQCEHADLPEFAQGFNQRIHQVLASYVFTKKFAHHAKLLDVTERQLKYIFSALAKTEDIEPQNSLGSQFIYLSSMKVHNMNACSFPHLVGAPSLIGIWGFIHNFQRQINHYAGLESSIEFESFAFFVRKENIRKNAKLSEPSTIPNTKQLSPIKRPITPVEFHANIEFDLIIQVKAEQSINLSISELEANLPTSFAGGKLFPPSIQKGLDWIRLMPDTGELLRQVRGLPSSGRWLFPTNLKIDSLKVLKKHLESDNSLIPGMDGYAFLESPKTRLNASAEQHVYAENSLTLIKKINPIEARFFSPHKFLMLAFWGYQQTDNLINVRGGNMVLCRQLTYRGSISTGMGAFYYIDSKTGAPRALKVDQTRISGGKSAYSEAYTGDDLKLKKEKSPHALAYSNPLFIEKCTVPSHVKQVYCEFPLRVYAHSLEPMLCVNPETKKSLKALAKKYSELGGFHEQASRKAKNILMGTWLWENIYCDDVKIEVMATGKETITVKNANKLDWHEPWDEEATLALISLTEIIENALKDRSAFAYLNVKATLNVFSGDEIHPSQKYLENDSLEKGVAKTSPTKQLVTMLMEDGTETAALSSQKIGAAIQLIDDWYGGENEEVVRLRVNEYGADRYEKIPRRHPSLKKDFYSLLKETDMWISFMEKNQKIPNEVHYIMSVLIKGGLFNTSKEK